MSSSTDPHGGKAKRGNESIQDALERSLQHAGLALSEGVLSARALLDVASLGISGEPASEQPNLAEFARTLDQVADALSGKSPSLRAAILGVLLNAIESEIVRWEVRSNSDDDARAVLRAFIGLREILWEMGIRREARDSPGSDGPNARWGSSANANWSSKEMKRARNNAAKADRTQRTTDTAAKRRAPRIQRIRIDD